MGHLTVQGLACRLPAMTIQDVETLSDIDIEMLATFVGLGIDTAAMRSVSSALLVMSSGLRLCDKIGRINSAVIEAQKAVPSVE